VAALVAPGGAPSERVLREHLVSLAPFRRPRRLVCLDPLPLLPNGKVDRPRCREMVLQQRQG
ncbi:MAG TPA: hypothetical protein VNB06_13655, partial [Thermoanaerobaculia bacterium]|nr:hypothetical protein [Thermoanaerobaculia bacterium]